MEEKTANDRASDARARKKKENGVSNWRLDAMCGGRERDNVGERQWVMKRKKGARCHVRGRERDNVRERQWVMKRKR